MRRQRGVGVLFVVVSVAAALLLADVLATVFFSISVAYLLLPLKRELQERGLSNRWASLAATFAALVATAVVFAPVVLIVFLRLDTLISLVRALPREVTVTVLGSAQTVTFDQVLVFTTGALRTLGRTAAAATPVLLVKATLFVFVLFGLLYHATPARKSLLAVVPPEYRDVAEAFDQRTRQTLFAIYVLQAATAVGTFLIALPLFVVFGYEFPIALAAVAAILQFVPIVGPSFLLLGIAAYHLALGQVVQAALVFAVGGALIAWLPDVIIRPRLARDTTNLPGTLYFVGFAGGVLTVGAVGVIAGPLVVALAVEAARLLSEELNGVPVEAE